MTDDEVVLLQKVQKIYANKWLFKSDSLYQRLNVHSYTRLVTSDQVVSGGDISQPPMGNQDGSSCGQVFSSIKEGDDSNSAEEMKNRLAWAAFRTKTKDETDKMTAEKYAGYQKEWQKVRDMKASDYRDLLKPEKQKELKEFEKNSLMTVKQIVDYIDIVETEIGENNFDTDNWTINGRQFNKIMEKVNGTYGDEDILKNKTREDVPPEKKELLKYLEENGLLLDQFKAE